MKTFSVCLIAGMIQLSCSSQVPGLYAVEAQIFRNKRTTSKLLKNVNSRKLLYCTRHCLDDLSCMSFFYKATSNECQLHSTTFIEMAALQNDHGWKYYHVFTGPCTPFDEYVENRKLNLCYKLYPAIAISVPLYRSTCAADGGELLKINSQVKQDHIVDFLENVNIAIICIQGDDITNEGIWRYEDGTLLSYTNWHLAECQPDDGSGDYIIMRSEHGYKWYVVEAKKLDMLSGFICQRNI